MDSNTQDTPQTIPFKAETRQLLDILIHSLYVEREVFLREVISNASDALTRMNFELLTNRDVINPDAELGIWISVDKEHQTLTIRDTGVGMTQEEMIENLGIIAHSGVKTYMKAMEEGQKNLNELIGQFGVGFYSAFMVADSIEVLSRSFKPDAQGMRWYSSGNESFTIHHADKSERGTDVIIHLKPDAIEFTDTNRLKEIIKKHSDYIPYPIYLENDEQINRQTALWRQQPRQVEKNQYFDFYRQITYDIEDPLLHIHMVVDAPVQLYALLFVPSSQERNIFSSRKQDGLKLYARKVLIQEYCQDLLPNYFRFIQGVVDSEDIPLNVSRESVQSSRIISQLKTLVTNKVIEAIKTIAKDDPEKFELIWKRFGKFIKEGIATDPENYEALIPLLHFPTIMNPQSLISLSKYVEQMKEGQRKIYYIVSEDERTIFHSPHLEAFRSQGYDVLVMSDPLDPFMLLKLRKFNDYDLANVATEDAKDFNPDRKENLDEKDQLDAGEVEKLINLFKQVLGEKVSEVRATQWLVESPARLTDKEGTLAPEIQKVMKLINQGFENPQKILEINPTHPIIHLLEKMPDEDPLAQAIIEQIYEDALLIDGLHPDPAGMVKRIQKIMESALSQKITRH